jgi:hypothetical protein
MRYITYEILPVIHTCVYKVQIKPGKAVGFGFTYKDAVENALRFEAKNIYAIDEKPKQVLPRVLRRR